jgi:2-polyprenyl-6-hydroxyphenyl methylase/3-demethylubiquinone-9 3-methyltransferase
LDFGGGSGLLAERLRAGGFRAETYDPFSSFCELPDGSFDLITCFEVLEHLPWPRETVAAMVSLLKRSPDSGEVATEPSLAGVILFSTLVQPADIERVGVSWWYAAPRNGHISLYSRAALTRLFGQFGLRVHSFNEVLHMAYGRVPEFARRLNLPE